MRFNRRAADIDEIDDPLRRNAIIGFINNFGAVGALKHANAGLNPAARRTATGAWRLAPDEWRLATGDW